MSESITILDGGMGSELMARGIPVPRSIWSAAALTSHPDAVVDIHRDYALAGADVVTTNNYGVIPAYLKKVDQPDALGPWTEISVELARKAVSAVRGETGRTVAIAGSLPPLVESYRPDLVMPDAELAEYYDQIVQALQPGVDLYLAETMSSIREAKAAAAAVNRIRKPDQELWIAYTLADRPGTGLRSGESIADAAEALEGDNVTAILFNCCPPQSISAAMADLRAATAASIGGYANYMQEIPKDFRLDGLPQPLAHAHISAEEYTEVAAAWVAAGARILGGCCGMGPDKIRALSRHFNR